jgi:hypothetical protein
MAGPDLRRRTITMVDVLEIICLFLLTWFAGMPQPIWVVTLILEAIALVLVVEPLAFRHAPLW